MHALTLYSYRRCPFAIRVRMVLEEKQIPYQGIEENLSELSPALLALHPEGRVPLLIHTLEDQKIVIYQSSIITEYLDESFPALPLMPKHPIQRTEVRLWTYWCDQIFKPDLDLYKYESSQMDVTQKAELTARLSQHLTKWNHALQSKLFLMGEEMTLADLHLFPFARQFLAIRPAFAENTKYPFLTAWLDRMVTRPTFKKVMQK